MELHTRADNNAVGSELTSVTIVSLALTAVVVLLRMITRIGIVRKFGADDFTILVSVACSIAVTVYIYILVANGYGKHFDTLPKSRISQRLKPFWVLVTFYNLSITFTKISILLSYLRVFVIQPMRRICWGAMVFVVLAGLCTVLSWIFNCLPVSLFWDKSIRYGTCHSHRTYGLAQATLNIATDLVLFTLPLPSLSSLNLPKKQKVSLLFVFCLGFFVCIISMLRIHWLDIATRVTDVTWADAKAIAWSAAEINIAIITASLPSLNALVIRRSPQVHTTNTTPLDYSSNSSQPIKPSHEPRSASGNTDANECTRRSRSTRSQGSIMTVCEGYGHAMSDIEKGHGSSHGDNKPAKNGDDRIRVQSVVSQEVESRSISSSQRQLIQKDLAPIK